jgi:two-component system, chemotaxis family, protein-glutamate methylesterase/glutaminase
MRAWEAVVSQRDVVSRRDTVVVGASAGGVAALRTLLADLPAGFPARILIVLHVPASGVNALASVLARSSPMRVRSAMNGDQLEPGVVLVARPDHHLMVVDDSVRLTRGPRENGHRPAIDVLFRSAAKALGPRTIGVVLSGALDDGSAGLRAIRARGGLGVVQDPDDAQHSGMPSNAIRAADPEYVVPVAEMPGLLPQLIGAEVESPDLAADKFLPAELARLMETEVAMAEMSAEGFRAAHRPGVSSGLSCPDCHGVLFSIGEADFPRFRCRVGHAWSAESLMAEHRTAVEGALWMALRALEEKAALCLDMSDRVGAGGAAISARRFSEQSAEARDAAQVLRGLLAEGAGIETDIEHHDAEADTNSEGEGGRFG